MNRVNTAGVGVVVAAALGAFGLAMARVESGTELARDRVRAVREPANPAERESAGSEASVSTPDRDHLDRPDHGLHTAVAIVDEFEDGLSARWDQLSPKERRHELRRQFDVAMGEIAAADDRRGAEARADAALSALRAELHGTPDGAREHQRLEHQLDVARAGDEP